MAVRIIDTLATQNDNPFPVALANDLKGGIHSVADLESRNAIPSERLLEGMLCYVQDEKAMYQYVDSTWQVFETGSGGGGGGVSTVYISSESSETLVVNEGNDLEIDLNFISPNPGKGTVNIAINNIVVYTTSITQGGAVVTIPERLFSKGSQTMSIYAIDRGGILSNTIIFEVRYGSLEFKSHFDSTISYDVGSSVRYYFTPTSADTSVGLTLYMIIDDVIQAGVSCVSDVRSYYTFPTSLSVGCHKCVAYIVDNNGNNSNSLEFNLVLLDSSSIVVVSETNDVTIEEGIQLSLDFKIFMKNNISFITKIYVDNELVNTGTCGLEKSYYKTSSLLEGEHTIRLEVYNESQTVSDSISWNVIVTESQYDMIEETKAGLLFSATAYNKTNSDEGKEQWIGVDQDGNNIVATLSNFSFNNESGWVDDSLIISGISHVEIPVKPLANNASNGLTLDIEFLSKQIGVADAEVLTLWDDTKNCGIKITTENVILRSAEGNECNLYFTDNELINVIFVIDRDELTAKIYLNGVMCEAFHLSDYVANGVYYLEDFSVQSNIFLGGENKNGHTIIKNIRIYEVALTTSEILNNFISTKKNKAEQQALVEFQKGNDLPTLTIYCDFSGLGKDDKKPCKIIYNSTDELKYGKSFVLDHKKSQLQYQGTSSMAYPIKNYRLNLRDENGDKWYYDFPKGKPECRFTLKADFMSSGHWQNTGFTKWVNDNLYNYDTSDEKSMNPKKWFDINNGGSLDDTRECIYGFPCRLILVNDGTSPLNEGQNEPLPGNTKDMGIFNFNHDKDCADTIGFDQNAFPNCASFEIAANSDTSAGAFMSYNNVNPEGLTELEYLKQSFELRFPDAEEVSEEWGFFGTGEDGTGIKNLIEWVDNCTDEEFVQDFEEHFHKDYTLRYFLMVMVCGMVDNLGKNLMLDTWDNKIFMPRFYDCDTICSYDNSGDIKFDVDIEMEQGYWNTSSSRLWTRVRDLMHNDLVEKYNNMRQNGLSYESLMSCFYDEQIAKIPQKYYNMDFDVKYAPFADSYLGMAHGDGYEHLKRWLKKRLIFCDTLYDYSPSYNNDVLTIRANTTEPMTIYIETYTPLYQHISWYNGQMDKKKIDGNVSVAFTGTAMASTDQEVLIYGGSNIKRITGIQSMNPNQMLIGYATKLTEIDASNCLLLNDINSDGANLSPHVYLNNVNLSDCVELTGNLRLDNSPLIQNIDLSGTSLNGIILPTNLRNLETLKLSEDIKNLTLRDASLLNEINIPSNIEYLSLLNVPRLTTITSSSNVFANLNTLIMENPTINPISNIISKSPNIEYVRLTGLNIQCTSDQFQKLLNAKGLDAIGNEIPLAQSVTGSVVLSKASIEIEQELKSTFPLVNFSVLEYIPSRTVTFKDGDGNILYTTLVTEGGEVTYVGETPTKTSTDQYNYEWSGWDRDLKPIISDTVINATFNNILRYYRIRFIDGYTNEVIQDELLAYGTTIIAPEFPDGQNAWDSEFTTVTGDLDVYSKYIPYPEDLSIFNFTKHYSWLDEYTVSLKTDVELPSYLIFPYEYNGYPVTRISGTSSYTTENMGRIKEIYIPDSITNVENFSFCRFGVSEIHLPSSVTTIGANGVCCECTSLIEFSAPGITSVLAPTSYGMFDECTSLERAYFGSKEHPFRSYRDRVNYGSTQNHFGTNYNTSTFMFVNFITENGLQSDLQTFENATYLTNVDKVIFSTEPVEVTVDSLEIKYMIYEDYVAVIDYNGEITELIIPEVIKNKPITTIRRNAFYGNNVISSITAPSILEIKEQAFENCETLVTANFSNCKYISTSSFESCGSLKTVNLENVETIGERSFYYSTYLENVNCPNVVYIENFAFRGCTYLKSVSLSKVEYIGEEAFYGCTNLTLVTLPKIKIIMDYSFYRTSALTSVTIGGVSNPVDSTFSATTTSFTSSGVTDIYIYVSDPSNPPTLNNLPWGATDSTITYEQS